MTNTIRLIPELCLAIKIKVLKKKNNYYKITRLF